MSRFTKNTFIIGLLGVLVALTVAAGGSKSKSFSPYVDEKGNISLPSDFRMKWVHLGSWAVPAPNDPGSGFHDVYTQPETVEAYKKTGKFPDSAVLVKEIRKRVWDEMATGHIVYAGDENVWFVMVRDNKGRFLNNPNWGDGWGWALFNVSDRKKNASTDHKNDCLACHEPAKATEWVYVHGYPTLR